MYLMMKNTSVTEAALSTQALHSAIAEWIEITLENPKAVGAALAALYRKQTAAEQEAGTASTHNGVGFNKYHASSGKYYAEWVISGKNLSGRHLARARSIASYYMRQLVQMKLSGEF